MSSSKSFGFERNIFIIYIFIFFSNRDRSWTFYNVADLVKVTQIKIESTGHKFSPISIDYSSDFVIN